ncbi:MAG TPA: hypothetical protein DCM40_08560 [Maribacter sp.]|nr:hypothetical protein [Maribacter sp.]
MKKNYKNRNYLEFVSRMRCIILHKSCNGATNAHHLLKPYDGARGMGMRATDNNTIPLCYYHHSQLHNVHGNEDKFWKQYGLSEDFGRIQAKMFWDKSPYRKEEE